MAAAFSEEDLLRIFEVLTKAETDLRLAQDPRVTLEMALLKIVQMQRLLPFAELVARVERLAAGRAARPRPRRGRRDRRRPAAAALEPAPRRPSRARAAGPRAAAAAAARARPPQPRRAPAAAPAPAADGDLADGRMRSCRR